MACWGNRGERLGWAGRGRLFLKILRIAQNQVKSKRQRQILLDIVRFCGILENVSSRMWLRGSKIKQGKERLKFIAVRKNKTTKPILTVFSFYPA